MYGKMYGCADERIVEYGGMEKVGSPLGIEFEVSVNIILGLISIFFERWLIGGKSQ